MPIPECPNCHYALKPGDEICENWGAVLISQSVSATASAAFSSPSITQTVAPSDTPTSDGNPGICANCRQPIKPGDDILWSTILFPLVGLAIVWGIWQR